MKKVILTDVAFSEGKWFEVFVRVVVYMFIGLCMYLLSKT